MEVQNLKEELATVKRDRENIETKLSDLKQKTVAASELPDVTEKAGELLSLFKSLLPPKAKLPNGTISKIKKILEGDGD